MLDARAAGSHLVRFGLVMVLFLAIVIIRVSSRISAAGLPLFQAQLLVTSFYLSMAAIFGFSQTIAEEKEEGTLGLLRLAGVSPLAIVLGKTAGRLCNAWLLIAIQFPFTLIAITLGGISWAQVLAAYVALGTYLWLLATLGVLASVWQPTRTLASRWTAVVLAFYALPPFLSSYWGRSVLTFCEFFSLPVRICEVTSSSFDESPWCSAVFLGLFAGCGFLSVAWWSLERRAAEVAVAQRETQRARRINPRGRAWDRPVVWREFHFLTGGMLGIFLRIGAQIAIFCLVSTSGGELGFVYIWSAVWSGFLGILDGTWTASRLFRDEIHERTWSTLAATPPTLKQIAFDKLCGWGLGLAPMWIFPYLFMIGTLLYHPNARRFGMEMELVVGSLAFGVAIFAYLHLLVLSSLYFGWKGTPVALTVFFAGTWLYLTMLFTWGRNPSIEVECFWNIVTSLVLCAAIVSLQSRILSRLAREG